jgi:hypothetical protein
MKQLLSFIIVIAILGGAGFAGWYFIIGFPPKAPIDVRMTNRSLIWDIKDGQEDQVESFRIFAGKSKRPIGETENYWFVVPKEFEDYPITVAAVGKGRRGNSSRSVEAQRSERNLKTVNRELNTHNTTIGIQADEDIVIITGTAGSVFIYNNIDIRVSPRTEPLVIELNDVRMNGRQGQTGVAGGLGRPVISYFSETDERLPELTLVNKTGNNRITAGQGIQGTRNSRRGTDGGSAIEADRLYVEGTGQIELVGGRGGKGHDGTTTIYTGGRGGNGGHAIDALSLVVDIDGVLFARGGQGGEGGNPGGLGTGILLSNRGPAGTAGRQLPNDIAPTIKRGELRQ